MYDSVHLLADSESEEYFTRSWMCSQIMSKYIEMKGLISQSTVVFELGSGTGIPAIVASKLGARHVYLSDLDDPLWILQAERILNLNLISNCSIVPFNWGDFVSPVLDAILPIDLILCSDLIYDTTDLDALLATLRYLVINKSTRRVSIIMVYQNRCPELCIQSWLEMWGFTGESIPIDFQLDNMGEGIFEIIKLEVKLPLPSTR